MRGLLLQDWVTIRGQSDTVSVTQGSESWVELGDFEDLTIFLDVREASATPPKMTYESIRSTNRVREVREQSA